MQEPNWGNYRAKFNGKEQSTFQWFCYLLFCQEFELPLGISRYENHAGIETDPIQVGEDYIGWQAKFYDTPLSEHVDDLKSAIVTAKTRHPELTKVLFYTNRDFGQHPKKTEPKYKTDIEKHGQACGVSIIWRTESFFESPFVTKDNSAITKHFFDLGKSIIDFVTELEQHTQSVLDHIHSQIEFKGLQIKIDRSSLIQQIRELLKGNSPIIISGEGGVGKTAIVKDLLDIKKPHIPILLFKATEFNNLTGANKIFKEYGEFYISDFISAYPDADIKCVVIDSAEKLSDTEDKDAFKDFLNRLHTGGWKVIFTTRRSYLDDLRYLLIEIYGTVCATIDIPNLSSDTLTELSSHYSFALPHNTRLQNLLLNPFYLNEYLQSYTNSSPGATYTSFKASLWDKHIANSSYKKDATHIRREECFLAIAQRRANEGSFYVQASDLDVAILQKLVADEVIGFDQNVRGYFITHDIYEEWALEKLVESTFLRTGPSLEFYQRLGSSLPVRRAFRHWLSEKILLDAATAKALVETTIEDGQIDNHWRDEVLVSVLLSDHAKDFLDLFEDQLLKDEGRLLVRLTFLLRIACKEVDQNLLRLLGVEGGGELPWSQLLTMPKGSGWNYLIAYVERHLAEMGLAHIYPMVEVISNWNNKYKVGETTKSASRIALFYYQTMSKRSRYSGGYGDLEDDLIKTILNGALEIKDEIAALVDEVLSGKQFGYRHQHYELIRTILSSVTSSVEVCQAIPGKVLALADMIWVEPADEGNGYRDSIGVEGYFGLKEAHGDYFPASAFQTPTLLLLNHIPIQTVDFIVAFTNRAVEKYVKSRLSAEVEEITVHLSTTESVIQYISNRLWCTYRGTQASTEILESLHMALEKWLLGYAKASPQDELEALCLHLLRHAKSASITAVVASITLAYPSKLFNIAKILFRTKELFLYDVGRYQLDLTQKKSLLQLQSWGRNNDIKIYQEERIQACDEPHRNKTLEHLAVSYQFFKSENETEEEAQTRQLELWEIFDNHYAALPDNASETDADRTWRLFLARMDRRGMHPTSELRDDRAILNLNPDIDPELRSFSEESQKKILEAFKHTRLKLWACYRWENNKSEYEKYIEYETDIGLVVSEVHEVLEELNAQDAQDARLFYHSTPANACAVLVRDFADQLTDENIDLCGNVVMAYASFPLQNGYEYQVDDGVGVAIGALPYLMELWPDHRENVKRWLTILLLDSFHYNISDYAVRAINRQMWAVAYDDAHGIFLSYLLLKPLYNGLWEELRQQQYGAYIPRIGSSFPVAVFLQTFDERYGEIIEKALSNSITYADLDDIQLLDIHILKTAFEILPTTNRNEDHKRFLTTALPIFARELTDKHERSEFAFRHRILEKFAYLVLSSDKSEIPGLLAPFIEQPNLIQCGEDLCTAIISAQDQLAKCEEFWLVWDLLYRCVIEAAKNHPGHHNTKSTLRSYLFASTSWNPDARQWHTFQEKNKQFFKRIIEDIGGHPVVLFCLARLVNTVGAIYVHDAVSWLSSILEHDKSLRSGELEENTVYYLDTFVRKYIFHNRSTVKKSDLLKRKLIFILDFLIEKGSVVAYLAREDIL